MCPLQDYSAVADSQVLIFPSPLNRAEEGKHFRENPAAQSVYWSLLGFMQQTGDIANR
jgi:hypothetical protein